MVSQDDKEWIPSECLAVAIQLNRLISTLPFKLSRWLENTTSHTHAHTHSLKVHKHKWASLNICQTHSIQPILPLKPESTVGGRAETCLQSKSRLRDIQIKSLRRRVYTWTWLCSIHMAYSCAPLPYLSWTISSFQQVSLFVCLHNVGVDEIK